MEQTEEKLIVVQISPKYHQRLKIRAAILKKTLKEVVEDALKAFFREEDEEFENLLFAEQEKK